MWVRIAEFAHEKRHIYLSIVKRQMPFGFRIDISRIKLECVCLYVLAFAFLALVAWLDIEERGCVVRS